MQKECLIKNGNVIVIKRYQKKKGYIDSFVKVESDIGEIFYIREIDLK